jgi:ppGpp synthetase/RelA/SpoT-type nucleotidyltranferase
MSNTTKILEEFEKWGGRLPEFQERTRSLLLDMIQASGISIHSIQARTKTRESLRAKCERPDKNYQDFFDVTDVVAFRIIAYFHDDVDKIAKHLNEAFTVDPVKSIDKRMRKPTEFGYSALHSICRYCDTRESLLENRNFRGLWWEVQICSILQHAWNEIEHNIGYKSQSKVPTDIERRLHRLAGTLELVDAEFKEIRDKTENYRMAVDLRIESQDTDISDVGIDSISLLSFMRQDPIVLRATQLMAERFKLPIEDETPDNKFGIALNGLQVLQIRTLQELRQVLLDNMEKIPSFLEQAIKGFVKKGIGIDFSAVRRGTVLTNLVVYLIGKQGAKPLDQLFQETGAYGQNRSHFAEILTEAARTIP